MDAGTADGGKEVVKVYPEHDALAGVDGGESLDGSARHEAVNAGVNGNPLKYLVKNISLDILEAELRRLNQTRGAG